MESKVRVIAMYLPQFHPIPENDEWWGKGFTEWTNVAMAKPLFKGHYQPRVPADLGFYDLRLPDVREAQAEMAKEAGIEGFMYWHYWFGNGLQLLERPFNEVLASGKPDFPFCLGWANHSWSRKTWTAKSSSQSTLTMLLEQTYQGDEDYIQHFNSVLPAFKDPRYITVDGKPLFLIYSPLSIPNLKHFMDLWKKLADENGLKGIHFVGNANGVISEGKIDEIIKSGVDATVFANISNAEKKYSLGKIGYFWKKIKRKILLTGAERYDYNILLKNIHSDYEKKDNIYPSIVPQMDRTPRSGKDAVIFTNSTPDLFKKYLGEVVDIVKKRDGVHKVIFIDSWNEWGEGKYLEPDIKYGHAYLDALKEVLKVQ